MGSLERGGGHGDCSKEAQRKAKPYLMIIYLSSFLVCIAGSFVLGWWIYKYHPTNTELWMVPFGLVLFLTPVFVGFSLIVPDPCVSKKDEVEEEEEEGKDSLTDIKR